MRRGLASLASVLALFSQTTPALAECGLSRLTSHADPARTRIYAATRGAPAVYFRSDLDVNTDGASRSYHPDDPRGQGVALNNIGNAISGIWNAAGQRIDCTPRTRACFTRYINTFTAARDAGWRPSGAPRVATEGIIPWRMDAQLGRRVPCTIASGPYRGYFVSQTAFIADSSRAACDQARYLDSLTFNAAVIPRNALWSSIGRRARVGDVVVVRSPANGQIVYGILGDVGPARSIGEGSIAMAAALRRTTVSPTASYRQIRAMALPDAQYLIFPGAGIRGLVRGAITQADIDREGARLFAKWGGEQRLTRCVTLPRA